MKSNPSQNVNIWKDYEDLIFEYKNENRLRNIPDDGENLNKIDLLSNDYLGLSKRWKEFMPEFNEYAANASFSSSASRLLSRRQCYSLDLEKLLSNFYNKDILLFNSGYHANIGTIQALNIPGTHFLCDKLIHASMIDGLIASRAEWSRWKHNDINSLRRLLEKHCDSPRLIIMVESIYSMDGDQAPLKEILQLKNEFPNIILYVDEAHGFGVRGDKGLGLCEELGILDNVDIIVGTLGKAAASSGAFVATSSLIKKILINRARSFIFSTALPPINHAWSYIMIQHIVSMTEQRQNLIAISKRFHDGIKKIIKNNSLMHTTPQASHIIPLITGNAALAIQLANALSSEGIDALPIRRPTVPEGGERIRFSLSADLSATDIDRILSAIEKIIS